MSAKPIAHFVGPFSYLSNFYVAPFKYNGITYQTVEHYFQAQKVWLPDENHSLEFRRIVQARDAKTAKRLGRTVTLRPGWDALRLEVMRNGLHHKFNQNPKLAARLMMTGNKPLIEGNNWGDMYWGAKCREYNGEHRHEGRNWLGWLLMAERAHLLGTR